MFDEKTTYFYLKYTPFFNYLKNYIKRRNNIKFLYNYSGLDF